MGIPSGQDSAKNPFQMGSAPMTRTEQLSQARKSGRYAREAGRPISSCPLYGITEDAAELRKQWQLGYNEWRRVA
ncbi:hypothetical protein [Xanthomonas citri]|nr:hypothetical protein [Xanthomonas citri]QTF14244.1 hypothetical protein XcfCFBP6991P_24270 [Xanthomonas citri pv. phaseoli var. fuscans]